VLARLHAVPTGPLLTADGLFPVDADGAGLRSRLESGFADLAGLIAERPGSWPLAISPEQVATQALAMLPAAFTPVVLHSNPGPTHVFVAGSGAAFTGLIDFGDAYISHPALDLRSWPDPADRLALRDGYLDGKTSGADFEAAWTASMIYTDVAVLASRPELADAAAVDLKMRLAVQ
jgi:aminoglycoside phosphotransferase (APT) family kinase protein